MSANLFCLVFLTLEFLFAAFPLQHPQYVSILFIWCKITQYFLTKFFIAFNFIVLSYLNSIVNNLIVILSIRVFFVNWIHHCLMYLNISFIRRVTRNFLGQGMTKDDRNQDIFSEYYGNVFQFPKEGRGDLPPPTL